MKLFKSEKVAFISITDNGSTIGYALYVNNEKKKYVIDENEMFFVEKYFNVEQEIDVTDLIPPYLSQLNDIVSEKEQ